MTMKVWIFQLLSCKSGIYASSFDICTKDINIYLLYAWWSASEWLSSNVLQETIITPGKRNHCRALASAISKDKHDHAKQNTYEENVLLLWWNAWLINGLIHGWIWGLGIDLVYCGLDICRVQEKSFWAKSGLSPVQSYYFMTRALWKVMDFNS